MKCYTSKIWRHSQTLLCFCNVKVLISITSRVFIFVWMTLKWPWSPAATFPTAFQPIMQHANMQHANICQHIPNAALQSVTVTLSKTITEWSSSFHCVGSPCHLGEVTTASGCPYGGSRQTGSGASAPPPLNLQVHLTGPADPSIAFVLTYLENWMDEVYLSREIVILFLISVQRRLLNAKKRII